MQDLILESKIWRVHRVGCKLLNLDFTDAFNFGKHIDYLFELVTMAPDPVVEMKRFKGSLYHKVAIMKTKPSSVISMSNGNYDELLTVSLVIINNITIS